MNRALRIAVALPILIALTINCALRGDSLSEADELMFRLSLDHSVSMELNVGVGETYSISIRDGKWGSARIIRSRVVLQSEWDDIEYYLDVSTAWDNAALRQLLSAINARIAEAGLSPVDGRNSATQDDEGDANNRAAGVLFWGRDGEFDWRTLPLDSGLTREIRVLFERYIGGVVFYRGIQAMRDERVFVFEGSGLQGEEVDIEEFKKNLVEWSGRRVIVEGELWRLADSLRLVKGPHKFVGIDGPTEKLAGIRNGTRVRIHGNFVKRGEQDETGYIYRITAVDLLTAR